MCNVVQPIRIFARALRRFLRLSPMNAVMRELEKRGVSLWGMSALEIFGHTGEFHTLDYCRHVGSLEIWEIDNGCKERLEKNFPHATVKITDSYREIRETPYKYDFIVADNPMTIHGTHCEHFDLFPWLFRVMRESAVIVLNVIPSAGRRVLEKYPSLFNSEHLGGRSLFYGVDHPENITFEEMIHKYDELFMANNVIREWHFVKRRSSVHYLVMKIKSA